MVREWTAQAGLTLHPEKTQAGATPGRMALTFLATTSRHGSLDGHARRACEKFKDTIRAKTRRTVGRELDDGDRRPQSDAAGLV